MARSFRDPEPFLPDGESTQISTKWEAWIEEFDHYANAQGFFNVGERGSDSAEVKLEKAKLRSQRRSLLLYTAGQRVREIYKNLKPDTTAALNSDYNELVKTLTDHFVQRKNEVFQRLVFRQTKQNTTQSISQFVTRLRCLTDGCQFHDANIEIRDQLVAGIISDKTRRAFFKENNLTLTSAIDIAIQNETLERQCEAMSNSIESGKVLNIGPHNKASKCGRCGNNHGSRCPAFGQSCHKCGKLGHFSKMCSTKNTGQPRNSQKSLGNKVRNVNEGDSEPNGTDNQTHVDDHVFTITNYSCTTNNHSQDGGGLESNAGNSVDSDTEAVRVKTGAGSSHCKGLNTSSVLGRQGNADLLAGNSEKFAAGSVSAGSNAGNCEASSSSFSHSEPPIVNCGANTEETTHIHVVYSSRNNILEDWFITVAVGGVDIRAMIDSGSSANVISKSTWEYLKANNVKAKSRLTSRKLYPYGSKTPLDLLGIANADICAAGHTVNADFDVVNGQAENIIGRATAIELGILRLGINAVADRHEDILSRFKHVFTGVGKLKSKQIRLAIDDSITPVAQPYRRVPHGLRKKLEDKLDELLDYDIIKAVNEPAEWVSPIVVSPKRNGDIRMCVDMRRANAAVIRERHPLATVDEIIQDMHGCQVFSNLDMKWGFHQLELEPGCRHITA